MGNRLSRLVLPYVTLARPWLAVKIHFMVTLDQPWAHGARENDKRLVAREAGNCWR